MHHAGTYGVMVHMVYGLLNMVSCRLLKYLVPESPAVMTYSLRSELLVSRMDVSRYILVLDASISAMSNLERREYLLQDRLAPHPGEYPHMRLAAQK